MEGLGCCSCCCCLWVLWVLDWAGSRVAGRPPMLRWTTLLSLARGRGRRLGVLRVGVQGSAWVRVLLGHRTCRHIHGVCLLWVLCSGGRDQAGLAMCGRSHHPGTALHYWTEHMLRLGLVVWHLLDQRLTGELLRAAGEVLGRVGGARCYNGWSCCRRWVHHGGRARRVVLV